MDTYTFSATPYCGVEDEILQLRNANRTVAQTRNYLDWRYAKSVDAPKPLVFWIRSMTGKAVGMASLIFRPYWVNNRQIYLGVLGDISLDEDLRGKGLGRQILEYIKHYLAQHMPDQAAFVIPNEAAQKSLNSAGWEIGGRLVPYVLPLTLADRMTQVLKNSFLTTLANKLIRQLISIVTRLHIRNQYSLQIVTQPDASFEALWSAIPKVNMILSGRGLDSLTWRYIRHPHEKFNIAKLLKQDEIAGYLIFTASQSNRTFYIYDLIVKEQKDLLCMLALFLKQTTQHRDLSSVRLVLSDKHPYCKSLWKLGFIQRKDKTTFHVYWPDGHAHGDVNWALSLGDKDV